MRRAGFVIILVGVLLLSPARAQEDWTPVPIIWDDASPTLTHIGRLLLDPPAGRHGFLTVRGDGFRFQDGTPARFWGVNLSAGANFPDHDVAERLAARLAKLGVNLVRLHHMDSAPEPRGIWEQASRDTRHLSLTQLDRLDYLVARLKAMGIHVDVNLHVGRPFTEADGVVEASRIPRLSKFVTLFDRRLMELQQEYARQLLTHRNPYTGRRYADEPAVALVELTNENSLFAGWFSGALDRPPETAGRPIDPWQGPIPAFYQRALDALWNQWLLRRYGNRTDLAAAWLAAGSGERGLEAEEDPGKGTVRRTPWAERRRYSAARIADLARFYAELERGYFREMVDFLHGEVGVKVPVTGTNNYYGLPSIYAQSAADYMDTHGYWDHPTFPGRPWDRLDFRITNRSLARSPGVMQQSAFNSSPIPRWTLSAVCDRPLVVSEWNQPFPNAYEYEMPLLVAAYGGFQGWDGLFAYTYRHERENWDRQGIAGWFDLDGNPVKLSLLTVGALVFLRGDVAPAARTVPLDHSEDEVFGRIREDGGTPGYGVSGLPPTLALRHRVCHRTFAGGEAGLRERAGVPTPRNPYVSDTGQLLWDGESGVVRIDTPRTQGALGFLSAGPVVLRELEIRSETDAAIVLTALDGQPLARSRRMLLVAVGRQMNSGQRWREDGKGLADWGTGPVLLQSVRATVALLGFDALRVYALDIRGERQGDVPVACGEHRCRFATGARGAVWYELVR